MSDGAEVCPYVGLQPFGEDDADYFFGRTRDTRVIVSNLYASSLTVLYGASGVGKSSVLLAGVVPALRASPDTVVVVFRDWVGSTFQDALKRQCLLALAQAQQARQAQPALSALSAPDLALPLDDLLQRGAAAVKATVVVILDQFEEYFLYHPPSDQDNSFDEALARAVNRQDVDCAFLIAMREDGLGKLDRFRTRIPNLLSNGLRLRHLDDKSAREAILMPLEAVYNKRYPQLASSVEPALVDELVAAAQGQAPGVSGAAGQAAAGDEPVAIETALLQLLLTKLWKAEPQPARGQRVLRRQTFADLGGAEKVVERHVAELMSLLAPLQQEVCARIFDRLVTPSGSKIACRESDLVAWAGDLGPLLPDVLQRLCTADTRVLRAVASAEGGLQYEIFHDVLADAILHWRRQALEQAQRAALERDAAEQRELADAQRQRARVLSRALWRSRAFLALTLVAALAAGLFAQRASTQSRLALVRALSTEATSQERTRPDLGLLLALHAVDAARSLNPQASREAADALSRAADASRLRSTRSLGAGRFETAISRDQTRLALIGTEGHLQVFSWPQAQELSLERSDERYFGPQFDPSATRLGALTEDGAAVRIWNLATGRVTQDIAVPPGGPATVLRFSADGSMVAVGGYAAWVWRLGQAKPLHTIDGHRDDKGVRFSLLALAFHPQLPLLATAAFDHTIRLWDLGGGKPPKAPLLGHVSEISDLQFSPDGKSLLSASQDGSARIWDVAGNRHERALLGHANSVFSGSFSSDGAKVVTTGADATARLWDAATGRELALLAAGNSPINSARFSADNRNIVSIDWAGAVNTWSASGHAGRTRSLWFGPKGSTVASADERTVRLWSSDTGEELPLPTAQRPAGVSITVIRFSPDGSRLALGDSAGRLEVIDIATGRAQTWCCHAGAIRALAFHPEGSMLASSAGLGGVAIWRIGTPGSPSMLMSQPRYHADRADWSPDGRWIASNTADGQVSLWEDGKTVAARSWKAHQGKLHELRFSPDSKTLLTSAEDPSTMLWDVASGSLRATLSDQREALVLNGVFTPDGARVMTADLRGNIFVWDTRTGARLAGPPAHAQAAVQLDISRDGSRLLSLSWDRTARVWDTATWQELARFTHREQIDGGAISPDGSRIATFTPYGGVRIIPLDLNELVAQAKARVVRELTDDECRHYLQRSDCARMAK